ncbi:MAG: ribokinase [Actinobacteria bacterium]|nr:ribokinase [Actinomycetota bacterium]
MMCHSREVSTAPKEFAFDVVVVGSANLDLVATLDHLPKPGETIVALGYAEHAGGKGVNQAVACARMGARTAFVGCVGNDDAGVFLRGVLENEGIDTTMLRVVDMPTGRAFINVDSRGENEIVVVSGANTQVGVAQNPLVLPTSHVLLMQLEIPLTTVRNALQLARRNGALTVLNPAPFKALDAGVLSLVDVIVPNETESAACGGTQVLLDAGVKTVLTTLGERGAVINTHTSATSIAPHKVVAVDTVGAGDAFIGALSAELARGATISDAAAVGAVAGALATTVRGAVPSLPTQSSVRSAMNK